MTPSCSDIFESDIEVEKVRDSNNAQSSCFKVPAKIKKTPSVSISVGTNVPLNLFTIF
jgi:hypothetical protein